MGVRGCAASFYSSRPVSEGESAVVHRHPDVDSHGTHLPFLIQVSELVETVHMTLFLIMVGLVVQIVSLLRVTDGVSNRWKRYEKQVGTDTQLIADLANLELAREESWSVWVNPFVYFDVVDLHRLKLYVPTSRVPRRACGSAWSGGGTVPLEWC